MMGTDDTGECPYPFRRVSALEPAPEYALLRREQPVVEAVTASGMPLWVVSRYSDVRLVLSDSRFSRAALFQAGEPTIPGAGPTRDDGGILLRNPVRQDLRSSSRKHATRLQQIL